MKLSGNVHDISLHKKLLLLPLLMCFRRYGNLSFNRRIMGKVKAGHFSISSQIFCQMFY